jgi:hypothetical protein
MASTSKHMDEENVLNILNESDECLISDDSDNCEDDTAVDVAVDEEDSDVEEHSLGDIDYNSGFIWEDMDNYHVQRELFSGHSGPQNSAVNVQNIVSVFLLFFSRDIVHKIVVETNHYAEQFMNSRGRLFSFKSIVRQWTPVTENEIYAVLGLYLLMGFIQKPTLQTYFSRKRILSTTGFGDVISRDRFKL